MSLMISCDTIPPIIDPIVTNSVIPERTLEIEFLEKCLTKILTILEHDRLKS